MPKVEEDPPLVFENEFKDISPSVLDENEKALFYGDPKTGKSHAALTAPDPICYIGVGSDNEVKTFYSRMYQEKLKRKKDIFYAHSSESIGKMGRFDTAVGYDRTCKLIDLALEADAAKKREFATLVVDNVTVLDEFAMNKTIMISNTSRPESMEDYKTWKVFQEQGILIPFDNDYRGLMSLTWKFVSWLHALNKNVILIAHEYEVTKQDRKTKIPEVLGYKPLFTGNLRDRIAGKFDNVWRFSIEGQLYVARTAPASNPTVIAGSRIGGVLAKDYADVNFETAIKLFRNYAQTVNSKN